MIVVIIAGGSGTRLWPLSTVDYPKHLLPLINEDSLLQNTYNRIKHLADDKNIFIVPEVSHVEHVYKQLPNIPQENILFEPARRNTASCVILALAAVKKRQLDDQAILVMWADHLIRDHEGFNSTMQEAGKLAEESKKLVFVGIEPTYPSMAFNYIQKDSPLNNGFRNVYKLKQFVAKPDRDTAERYYESGDYLWNTGYLMGTLSTFEREMQDTSPDLWKDYQEFSNAENPDETYMNLISLPIDTRLSENIKDALVVQCSFDWMDVGSFHDLHGISHQDQSGNHIKGQRIEVEQVTNSYIRNEQDLPLAVIGLDNVAVVATKNGILITKQSYDQKVGDVAKRLQAK
jgi:mannose-1-phosphate guanylyltransferase/mannose-6-phosphate isomerase